jgi:signal-transduction protein with cAMP-binding, CBS, and nucleotidyltransferase domain
MGKIYSTNIGPKFIAEIETVSQHKKISITSPLFYEGQIPVAAILLINGHIQLLKNKKMKIKLSAGSLVGLNELMTNTPVKLEAIVEAESRLCFLDKSTILEIMKYGQKNLADFFKEEAQ